MIAAHGLTKRYGKLTALNNVSFNIEKGEIYGFIGPNGAGKSTTMKILACLLRPDAGTAHVCGLDVREHGREIRRRIGYMPDFLGVYDDLTVDEYLQFFSAAFGVPRRKRRAIIDDALELTKLDTKQHAMVSSLSRGMQQRLGVARVLVHDPDVLLLDEPTSGLDPRARIDMRQLMRELRARGKTIMVSSHILAELGEMCTSIGIVEKGRLVYSGTLADALARTRGAERIAIQLENGQNPAGPEQIAQALLNDQRVAAATAEDHRLQIELTPGEHGHHFLIEAVIAAGGRISAFEPKGVQLEDAFMRLTQGALQ